MIYTLILKPGFKNILRRLTSIIIAVFSVVLYSCSSSSPYPDDWGYVFDTKKHGDSIVSGNYNIQGESPNKYDTVHNIIVNNITDLIKLPGLSRIHSNFDNIIIKLINKESLSIILRAKTDTIYTTVFPDNGKSFSIIEDGLKMTMPKQKAGSVLGYLSLSHGGDVTLMKNTDGSLIARCQYRVSGLFYYFIPVFGSYNFWYKFPQYETG
jgi:hypothetical protein